MSLLTWTKEEFSTRVGFADHEHQAIFTMLNGLHDKVLTQDEAGAKAALDELIGSVANHFKHKEDEMKAHNYVAYAGHKAEHDKRVGIALDLQNKAHAGAVKLSTETTGFVRDWLVHHIPTVDRGYGPALSKAGLQEATMAGAQLAPADPQSGSLDSLFLRICPL